MHVVGEPAVVDSLSARCLFGPPVLLKKGLSFIAPLAHRKLLPR